MSNSYPKNTLLQEAPLTSATSLSLPLGKHGLTRNLAQYLLKVSLLMLLAVSGLKGWGQQVIGSFPGMSGGFEGTTVDNTTFSSAQAAKWVKNNNTQTIALDNTVARSGSNSLSVNNGSTGRRVWSPLITASNTTSSVTIQYWRRTTNATNSQESQSGVGDGTTTDQTSGTYSSPTAINTWEKVTYTRASWTYTNIAGVFLTRSIGTGGLMYFDDMVMYNGSADVTAPNSPASVTVTQNSSSPTTKLDVSWGAASGGVDGGGYIVVRYASAPVAADDPNQNGIYAIGNSIAVTNTGTVVYIGTATSFTDDNNTAGLSPSTAYYYKVYTVDKAFNYSPEFSNTGTAGTTAGSLSSDATLSALTSTAGALTPSFSAATISYTATVSNATTSTTVTPTKNQAGATIQVRVNGGTYATVTSGSASSALSLNVGDNPIDLKVTAQDGTTIKTYTITVTRAASTNADLSSLTTTAGALTPSFSSATTSYTASVLFATTSVTVTPTKSDANSTIQVQVNGVGYSTVASGSASGSLALNVGSNPVDVKVTAQDGTTIKTYTITVTRAAASTNADLSALTSTAGTLTPSFASGTTSYTASVVNTTTSVTVTPTRSDANSSIQVRVNAGTYVTVTSGSASSALSLNVGDNPVDVKVTAQDGTTIKTYTITVTRAAASTNADLSALTTTAGALTPSFASATTSYTASVLFATTSVTVTPTRSDANATIQVQVNGGGYSTVTSGTASSALSLNVGDNPIDVKVTAQDGTTIKTYTITVTRSAASTNADLSALATTAGALTPSFASATTSYTASVLFATTSVTVTPTRSDATATIQVRVNGGGYNTVTSGSASSALSLNVGDNPIDVKVTAQDGTTIKTYTITVTRAASTNADLSALTTTAGALTPSFSSATTSYTASVLFATTSVTVTPTKSDANSTIQVQVNGGGYSTVASGSASGSLALNVGSNPVDVKVTAQDGTTIKTYTITVTRAAASTNADLSALTSTAGTLTPSFASGTTSYTASVVNTTTSVTVTPTRSDANSSIQVRVNAGTYVTVTSGSASSALSLNVGDNPVDVKVTAQDGTTIKTYTITVTRAAASTNADLSALTTTAGALTPSFASATTSYTASVLFATTSVTVTPTKSDANATIQVQVNGGGYSTVTSGTASSALSLNVGDNPIDVKVTAQDGATIKTYTITVTRSAASTNADLSALATTAGALTPSFASATTSYTASVLFATTSVTVTSTRSDATATIQVQVNGGGYSTVTSGSASSALSLNVGTNPIDVKVTAQDGTTIKTYTITVTRSAASTNADLSALTTTAGTLTPAFASGTISYTASVVSATFSVTVTPTVSDATANIQVRVNGGTYASVTSGSASAALSLNVGSNAIDVKVTAQDGTTIKTYTITVTRADIAPNAPTINYITPASGSLSINFSAPAANGGSTITNYKYSTDGGLTFKSAGSTTSPIVITTISGSGASLVNGTSYNVQLRAFNNAGDGAATASVAAVPNGVIYFHNFGTTIISSSKPYSVAPVTLDANILSSTPSPSWTTSKSTFDGNGNGNTGQALGLTSASTSSTLTLTFTVATGYQLNITGFDFWGLKNSSTAYGSWGITINGTSVGTGALPGGAFVGPLNVSSPITGLSGAITIVFTMSNGTSPYGGTARLDDFTLYGLVAKVPTLTTPTATSVSDKDAILGATVSSNGNSPLTERGTVYGTSATPTGNALAEGGTTVATFTHTRTSLTANTLYYYRGYATNIIGTGYTSPDGTFVTLPAIPASSAASFTGSDRFTANWIAPSPAGNQTYTYTLQYSTTSDFSSGNQLITGIVSSATSQLVTGLTSSTNYWYRIRANNTPAGGGDGGWSDIQTLTTTTVVLPTLTTPTSTTITNVSAFLGATVTSNGGETLTARGTVYGTSANPTGNDLAEGGTGTGAFSQQRTLLNANTLYYYRGYATNSAGTAYTAPDGTFTTLPDAPAAVNTANNISINSFTANWTAPTNVGAANYGYEVQVSTDNAAFSNPFTFTVAQSATPAVSVAATGLAPGTTYYYRVRAVNAGGNGAYTAASAAVNTLAGSTISANAPASGYLSNISTYASFTAASGLTTSNSLAVMGLSLNDLSGDGLNTTLTNISFTIPANTGSAVKTAALFDGTTNLGEVAVSGTSISFSSLSISAADNSSKTFDLRVTFKTAVTDNHQMTFTVSSVTAGSGSSTFAAANGGGAVSSTATNVNTIRVAASQLVFTTSPPATASVSVTLTSLPVVTARDANGNTDLDYTFPSLQVSNTAGLTQTNAQSATNGVLTFTGFQFTSAATGPTGSTTKIQVQTSNFSVQSADIAVTYPNSSITTWSSGSNASAWCTTGNWSNGTPTVTQVAQFANSGTTTNYGVNFGTCTPNILGIEITSARITNDILIGSSSTTSSNITLIGGVINSTPNVILRNNSGKLFTIQPFQTGSGALTVALGNATENIVNVDGTGGISISSVISGAGRNLTKAGSGAGILTLSGVNTYTGTTTVSTGTLVVSKTGYNATITPSTITMAFTSTPSAGTFSLFGGGPLSGSQTFSATGLSSNQTASFNASTSTVTVGSITPATTTLPAFTTTYGTASAVQTVTISGTSLTGNIVTSTAPTGYEVSSDGTTYGSTATFPASGGILRIRLSATATAAGSYNSQTITLTNGTATATVTTAASGNSVNKVTPTATLAVTNSPANYTGSGLAATVGITSSSVPGIVTNILTGGAATQTAAATYAVTADFVPTDGTNYNTLSNVAAGNFVIRAPFTLTYTAGANGTISGTSPQTVNYGASGTEVTAVPNAGYNFVNWSDNVTSNPRTDANVTADISVTANFAANVNTITFNGNNATGGSTATQSIATGATATLNANGFTRTGYTFAGWAISSRATTPTYGDQASYTMGTASVTLFAIWTPNNNTITFNGNTSTGGSTTSQVIATDATAALNANGFTKTGYTFAGWATTASGAVVYANQVSYTMGTANVTLFAKWTPNNNTITFDGNTSTGGSTASQVIATDATATLNVNGFTKTGYTFAGWATTGGGSVAYADQASYTMGTANVTLYAKWTPNNNTITFDGNTSTGGSTASQVIATDATAALTANGFTKTGYTFAGWATTAGGTVAYADQTSYTMGTANVTLYAQWTINTYTLTYTAGANGSISGTSPQTVNYGANGTAVTAVPATGYQFVNWSDGSTANPRTDATVSSNMTVQANFTLNTYSLTTVAGTGGSISAPGSSPTTVNHGAPTTITAVAATGYTFSNWTVTSGGANATIANANSASTTVTLTGAATVQANFTSTASTSTNWTGTNGGSWNSAGNWTAGIPDGTLNVLIGSGYPLMDVDFTLPTGKSLTINGSGSLVINPTRTLTIQGTANFGGKSVTLKSDATGTGAIGKITGSITGENNVTIERFIPNNGFRSWRLLSVPTFGSQTIAQSWQQNTQITGTAIGTGFDAGSTASILRYNGNNWSPLAGTTSPISDFDAYFLYVRGDRSQGPTQGVNSTNATTLKTTGSMYQGDRLITVSTPYALIGNTYPSAIDFDKLARVGVDGTYYIWDSKQQSGASLGFYQTFSKTNQYKPLVSTFSYPAGTENKKIGSGQAFFVYSTPGSGSITLTEDSKIAVPGTGTAGLRPATPAETLVKIDSRLYSIAGNNSSVADANVVVFSDAYSNAVDGDDARKLANTGENFALQRAGKTLAIEGRQPISINDTIFYNMWNMQKQSYTLEFEPSNLAGSGVTALLQDSYLNSNTPVDLLSTTRVNFTVDANAASSASNRFRLVFKASGALPVNFISISANRGARGGATVNWKVAAERSVRQYEVERSINGRTFTTAGTVTATGLSDYSFADANASAGTIFYRIKMVGMAGERNYSRIVKLNAGNIKPGFSISPNPAEGGVVNLQLINQSAGQYNIRLLSMTGQLIFGSYVSHAGGTGAQAISLPASIARGTYQVEIIAPDKTRTVQKLFINTNK